MRLGLSADATAGRRDAGAWKLSTRPASIGETRANAAATGTKNNNLVQALLTFGVTVTQKLQGVVPVARRCACHLTQLVVTLPRTLILRNVTAVSFQKVTNGILMALKGLRASEVNPHPTPTRSVKPGATLLLSIRSTAMRYLGPRVAGKRRMASEACVSRLVAPVCTQPPRKRSGPVHVDMAEQEASITSVFKACL